MSTSFHVDVVSAESSIYSGDAVELIAPGEIGELGILARHAPLMTRIKPGTLRVKTAKGEELIYVSGGIMEVQPGSVTVLADTSVRAADLDEAKALEAKRAAEERLSSNVSEQERAQVIAELAQSVAQLAAIQKLRKR
jgi:F-type H+-transporting ATPase subunit epsilon